VLALALALHEGLGADTLRALLFTVALGIGLFTATTYALFMDLTDPRIGATQFSAFMGATNLCESQAARWGGALTAARGYAVSFSVLQLVAFAALLLVPFLRRRERSRSLESAKEAR
jgi:predicted MFS family arabinose efflux permease